MPIVVNFSGRNGFAAISKAEAAVRGVPKKGPIVRMDKD